MLLGIDQGTTGTTAIVYDERLTPQATGYAKVPRNQPDPGRVEVAPDDLLESVETAVADALDGGDVRASDVDAVGLANQGETSLCWDADGRPVHDAIVWQDRRTADRCAELRDDEAFREYVRETTGLRIDPYFSATKLEWLVENVDVDDDLYFGTTDTWLLWQLLDGDPYVTDHATASRTMLFDVETLAWDDRLLEVFGLDAFEPPRPVPMDEVVGHVAADALGAVDAPVAGCIVDQQAALYGQGCHEPGDAKCTYGTGSFLLMNGGTERVEYADGVLGTVGWTLDGETTYAYDGGIYTTGAFVDWLADSLEFVDDPAETEDLARSVESSNGVCAIPALTGLAAPYWDSKARGAFVGLDASTTQAHLVRAGLEGIAYRVRDVVDAMQSAVGAELGTIQVDGGLTANGFLMEYQAAVLGQPLTVSNVAEATSLGTAALAGRATGHDVDATRLGEQQRRVEPTDVAVDVESQYERWRDAVGTLRDWHARW
ncbi:MAG: glycerol kinase [Haloferacaceae archaeon]